jgi:hypothetical protein
MLIGNWLGDISKNRAVFNFGAAQEHDLEDEGRKLLGQASS